MAWPRVGLDRAGLSRPDSEAHWENSADGVHDVSRLRSRQVAPETETSTHYFWHHARNFRLGDDDFTEQLRGVFASALQEDVVAIAAQQRSIDATGDGPSIDINVDNCSRQARGLLEHRIAEEVRAGAG